MGFFSWVIPAVRNRRTVKTWIRCTVVLAVTLILMVATKTSRTMGQAGFFAALVAVMLPPNLALSLFLFAAVILLLGMLLGWAWSAAAMAAALSVRDQGLLAQQQQRVQNALDPNLPTAIQLQSAIFHGMFLDPRSSAVYGAFFFIGTFALGALRAYFPKLTLFSIFGNIVLDIMCSYGPYFPTSQYTLAKQFLIPTCYYVAVAIASLVILFPESLNHVWLTTFHNRFLIPTLELISIQSQALSSRPSNREEWARINAIGNTRRQALVMGTQALLGQVSMIDLEISVGWLGPGDIKLISGELKSLMFRAAGLHSFNTYVNDLNTADTRDEAAVAQRDTRAGKSHPGRFTEFRRKIREREARHGHDLDTLVPILAESSVNLRNACEAGVKSAADWFKHCNTRRWTAFFSKTDNAKAYERHAVLSDRLNQLETALDQYRRVERVKLVKPFERYFDPETRKILDSVKNDDEMFAARSLFTCFVFLDTLDAFSEVLIRVFKLIIDFDTKRHKPRIWAPSGFGKLWRKLSSKAEVTQGTAPLSMGSVGSNQSNVKGQDEISSDAIEDDSDDDEMVTDVQDAPRQKNPDALPPRTAIGKGLVRLGSIVRFFKSSEGLFALRLALVSVALWIPSVCTSSAWFYYENKGIWALIMAQTALALYAGDQIAGFVARLLGTLLGLVVGMAAWYIGAGRGTGNPYGLVVATTVIVSPCLLGRISAPPEQAMLWIMAGITVVFVVGYSWINTHIAILANPGFGVTLAWKRALLVIAGFFAAFIVMMFPYPKSSRTLVRKTLADTTEDLGSILASEIEAFLAEDARARSGDYQKVQFVGPNGTEGSVSPKERRVRKIARHVIAVSARLQALAPSLQTAKFEPQFQGVWPHDQYQLLHRTQSKIIGSFIVLVSAFSKLDPRWCSILVDRTPYLNPNFLSDIFSNVSIISNALRRPHALPASLPRLRDRLVYHERNSTHRTLLVPLTRVTSNKRPQLSDSDSDINSRDDSIDLDAARVDGSSIGFEELTLDVLMDEQLPAHSTAVVALLNIINLIDEMTTIIRTLCGETAFHGFGALQVDYLNREERVLGQGFVAKLQ